MGTGAIRSGSKKERRYEKVSSGSLRAGGSRRSARYRAGNTASARRRTEVWHADGTQWRDAAASAGHAGNARSQTASKRGNGPGRTPTIDGRTPQEDERADGTDDVGRKRRD